MNLSENIHKKLRLPILNQMIFNHSFEINANAQVSLLMQFPWTYTFKAANKVPQYIKTYYFDCNQTKR